MCHVETPPALTLLWQWHARHPTTSVDDALFQTSQPTHPFMNGGQWSGIGGLQSCHALALMGSLSTQSLGLTILEFFQVVSLGAGG